MKVPIFGGKNIPAYFRRTNIPTEQKYTVPPVSE